MGSDLQNAAIALRQRQGNKLKARRAERNETQQQIAEAVGVTKAAVSDWESGKSYPRPHHQVALAKHYGTPWSTLFGLDGEAAA